MNRQDIYSKIDHTLLKQTASWEEIQKLCDEAIAYRTASVCIPPCYVKKAKGYTGNRMKICTVVGFPNGYSTTAVKAFETKDALDNGADEIDMVISIGDLKAGRTDRVREEICALKTVCGSRILKVIVETCLLTEKEKIAMCHVVSDAGADYIKTSTGFSFAGAAFDDVALFARHVGPNVRIKAAGGISSFDDAVRFIELGADRLGTSRIIRLAEDERLQR